VTINVHVPPQIEATLLSRARAQGMTLDAYVQSVIEAVATGQGAPALTVEEFETALDELAAGSERLPVLAPDAFSREGIYRDG
jgi:hypothetical protein